MDVFIRRRGQILVLEFCSDSFRRNETFLGCRHGEKDGKFIAAIAVGRIRLAQASFYHLTETL